MTRLGVRLPNEIGGTYAVSDIIDLARTAEDLGYHALWVPEESGRNAFMLLGGLATATDSVQLGTGIANVYSRTPALLAMSVATLDELSDGRAMLGLGASSRALIERWHGVGFDRPLRRIRETIEIVQRALGTERVTYDGDIFQIDDFPAQLGETRGDVPIYNAALGPTNRELTGRFADGWLPLHVPTARMASYIDEVASAAVDAGRPPDAVTIAPYIVSCVSETQPDRARRIVREVLAFYVGVMEYYAEVFGAFGFESEVADIREAWRTGGKDAARDEVPDGLLDAVTIAGTPEFGRERLAEYVDAGVDMPIVAIPARTPPELARSTLSELAPETR